MSHLKDRLLSPKELKARELDILLELQRFCESHDLRFYLAGGTLLGAVRHKGFIPWDDDIDVCMPRPDYERLIEIYPTGGRYVLRARKLGNFMAPFVKLVDAHTRVLATDTESAMNSRLWIDVFPVDGLPESLDKVNEIYKKCKFYREILWLNDAKFGVGKTTFHKYGKYIVKPLAKLYGRTKCVDHLDKIAQQYSYETSSYVGAVSWGLYGAGERMKKAEFEKKVMVDFEGYKMPAFSCWDSYLHGLYGDYMTPPPVEDCRTHNMKVYVEE